MTTAMTVQDVRSCSFDEFTALAYCLWRIDHDLVALAPEGEVIRLASHVRTLDGAMVLWNGPRSRPVPLAAAVHVVSVPLVVPRNPGVYLISMDSVVEHQFWGSSRGFGVTTIRVERSGKGDLTFEDEQSKTRFQCSDRTNEQRIQLTDPPYVDVHGEKLFLDPTDPVVSPTIALGMYEPFATEIFRSLVQKGATVVDVGAHIGYYTVQAANLVGANGRVEAFEPDSRNFGLLACSVDANRRSNTEIHQLAVASQTGERTLHRSSTNSGDHRLFSDAEDPVGTQLAATSLDDFFGSEHLARLDLMKIDTQGAETEVLDGARSLLRAYPNALVLCEFWSYGLSLAGSSGMELLDRIRESGRTYLLLDEKQRTVRVAQDAELRALDGPEEYVNILCGSNLNFK